jgi:hypothetical protein
MDQDHTRDQRPNALATDPPALPNILRSQAARHQAKATSNTLSAIGGPTYTMPARWRSPLISSKRRSAGCHE